MLVPRYWAECRLKESRGRRRFTVRRFGWSNDSPEAAQEMADRRAAEAMQEALADKPVERREPRVPYHGAEGVPIREEILQEHGDTIITRNSYGAWCLNTPNVLFVDVDYEGVGGIGVFSMCFLPVLGIVASIGFGWYLNSLLLGAIIFVALTVVAPALWQIAYALRVKLAGGRREFCVRRFERWVQRNQSWRVRLYETPAGLRALALHATFDPRSDEVLDFFRAMNADPVYTAMCMNQQCFRARLTAKPWRIGINAHMKPRPGVWPVDPARLPERQQWIEAYEHAARSHAACRFLKELGTGAVHRDADAVRCLHDDLSGALGGRSIA
ncbi:hypothetical protein GC173_06680 [bacterium]|nr:hypothetical protein [bacterium]